MERTIKHRCSTRLTGAPSYKNGFSTTPDVFRDAVALRYRRIPPKMKSVCDSCGEDFTVSHALDCKKGSLVAHRHNDFRDLNINLLHKYGLTQITEEPVSKNLLLMVMMDCVLTGVREVFGNPREKRCFIAAF